MDSPVVRWEGLGLVATPAVVAALCDADLMRAWPAEAGRPREAFRIDATGGLAFDAGRFRCRRRGAPRRA